MRESETPPETSSDDRAMLRAAVASLAVALSRGEVTPQLGELEALARICQGKGLTVEAARVRRWLKAARTLRIADAGRLIPG